MRLMSCSPTSMSNVREKDVWRLGLVSIALEGGRIGRQLGETRSAEGPSTTTGLPNGAS